MIRSDKCSDSDDGDDKYVCVHVYARCSLPLGRSKSFQRDHHALQPVSEARRAVGLSDWDRFGIDAIYCLSGIPEVML